MFHLRRDDVPFGGIRRQRGGDGGIVALRRARVKNYVPRGRSNQLRDLFAGRSGETTSEMWELQAAVSDRRRRSEIDATIYVAPYIWGMRTIRLRTYSLARGR
jgi:hypothetical protein